MKKLLFCVLCLLLITPSAWSGDCGSWGKSGSAPWYVTASNGGAASASYANINACINTHAAAGEVVNTTATGTVTWGTTLTIIKETHLIGPGAGSLTIRSSDNPIILFLPAITADNPEMEVAKFTFDTQNARAAMVLGAENDSPATIWTRANIHENTFTGTTSANSQNYYMEMAGNGGVVWKNTFSGAWQFFVGHNQYTSSPYTQQFAAYDAMLGTENALYLEDNIFTKTENSDNYITDCQFGGIRKVWRYNTFNIPNSASGLQTVIDWHGYGGGTEVSCQGNILYGNVFNFLNNGSVYDGLVNARGGRGLTFYNDVTSTNGMSVGNADGSYGCASTYTDHQWIRHYNWNNRRNTGTLLSGMDDDGPSTCDDTSNYPEEDWNYFNYNTSYGEGTGGVGCGTLGNRPSAPADRSAYWATDQSCSSVQDLVGDIITNSARNDIVGTLYVYESGSWTEWFTPYTYPHPLRSDAVDETAPTLDTASITTGTASISLAFDEYVAFGSGGNGGFTVSLSGGAATLSYDSGAGTSTLVYTISRTIAVGETGTISYTQPGDGLEDSSANDLESFSDTAISISDPVSTVHWVTTTGSAGWTSCRGDTDPSVYCSLATANSYASGGDTVYMLTGTYANDGYISPTNSGSAGNVITYQASGGTVTITGQTYGLYLVGNDYIKVTGITFDSNDYPIQLNNASHNEIDTCTFNRDDGGWDRSKIYNGSQYNWIHDSVFSNGGICSGSADAGSVLDIGDEENASDTTGYNLIEDSTFFNGGHHLVGLMSNYNTFRNNYLHNESWSNSKGNRTLYVMGYAANVKYNLIEGNRFGYTAPPCDDNLTGGVLIGTSNHIFRYNMFYYNHAYAMLFQVYAGYSNANYNHVYNNTWYANCLDSYWPSICSGSDEDTAIYMNDYASGVGIAYNVFKNNLYYEHYQLYHNEDQGSLGDQVFANEYNGDVSGNPLFTTASTTYPADTSDSSVPNFSLLSGSPAIDQGGTLTTVSSGCNSTSLTLADAGYFQDGTFAPSGTVDADYIAVGTVSNTAQITGVTYSTGVVTFASSVSCTNGASVWLYKDSDGTIVLFGAAPDAGAYESRAEVVPPNAIQGVTIN